MKILAFSGSHENDSVVRAFLRRIERLESLPDLFLSAGDLGPNSMMKIFETLSTMGKPIIYVLGNHPLHCSSSILDQAKGFVASLDRVWALGEGNVNIGGYTFVGQDAWTDFTDDDRDPERYNELKRRTAGLEPDKTILITHHAPLGIFDTGYSHPLHSYLDDKGVLHAGSLALRLFVEEFSPRIHIFAHCHSDGCRHICLGRTFFANICHLERRTRDGVYGVTGSFEVIDPDLLSSKTYHVSVDSPRKCLTCGNNNFIRYQRCVNCTKGKAGLIRSEDLP